MAMKSLPNYALVMASVFALLSASVQLARSQTRPAITDKILYSFTGFADGFNPQGTLILDSQGNLYGTAGGGNLGFGTVFQLTPQGTLKTFGFPGGVNGNGPAGPLFRDPQGNLYGTTKAGGTANLGTVFEITRTGSLKVLHSFLGGVGDGRDPLSGVVRDSQGNLYGTTEGGGFSSSGTVFRIAHDGTESILHSFDGFSEGGAPLAGLILDAQGNMYGTTSFEGANGQGTAFKVAPSGTLTVLYSFGASLNDGTHPQAPLIRDAQGNLYGTTVGGGTDSAGTVFKLTPAGVETVLYNFTGLIDGASPSGGLIRDSKGNLYGMTYGGGQANNCGGHCGTVFEVTPGGNWSLIYNFNGPPSDAWGPVAGLLPDGRGGAYGTTTKGGVNNEGTIFQVGP